MSSTLHHSSTGFTLIETVITVSMLAVIGVTLSSLIVYVYRTNNYVLQEGQAVQSAQNGLLTSLQNIREASYGDDGSYPLAAVGTSSITFYADTNSDGSVEKVSIFLLKGTLYQTDTNSSGNPPSYVGQSASTSTIATYIVNATSTPIFQYSDANGNILTGTIDTSQVESISTTLKIDVDPNRSPSPYTLLGSATLRNLR